MMTTTMMMMTMSLRHLLYYEMIRLPAFRRPILGCQQLAMATNDKLLRLATRKSVSVSGSHTYYLLRSNRLARIVADKDDETL